MPCHLWINIAPPGHLSPVNFRFCSRSLLMVLVRVCLYVISLSVAVVIYPVLIAAKLWTHISWAKTLGASGMSGPISSALIIVVESGA